MDVYLQSLRHRSLRSGNPLPLSAAGWRLACRSSSRCLPACLLLLLLPPATPGLPDKLLMLLGQSPQLLEDHRGEDISELFMGGGSAGHAHSKASTGWRMPSMGGVCTAWVAG